MTSFRQIQANRRNALKSTGPATAEGKAQSRRNAVRHGLTAETVIGTLEDDEDYKSFEAAIIADYDAQSAVERELVLRLASVLWRLRRASGIETGLFDLEAQQLLGSKLSDQRESESRKSLYALFRPADRASGDPVMGANLAKAISGSGDAAYNPTTDLANCFFAVGEPAKPCVGPALPLRGYPLAASPPDRVCT